MEWNKEIKTHINGISLNTRKSYKYQKKWKYNLLNFKMLPSFYGIPSNKKNILFVKKKKKECSDI